MLNDLLGLQDKGALVVGGGFGIGRATVEMLASAGMRVAILDREWQRAEAVATTIRERGGMAVPFVADVIDPASAEAVSTAVRELGGLDVLVNVVGLAVRASLLDMAEEEFDLDLSRNLRYQFRYGRAFAREHGSPGGSERAIVNVASIGGMNAAPGIGGYGAAKAALMELTKTMAIEWAPLGIRVNAVAPGSIITDRYQGTPELNARRAGAIPLGRLGEQVEIAKAVLFLASGLSSYVTGHTLVVDGGVTSVSALPRPTDGQDGMSRLGE